MTVQDALPPTDLEAFYNEQRQAHPEDEYFLHRPNDSLKSQKSQNETFAIREPVCKK
jgi:hypothetical protein